MKRSECMVRASDRSLSLFEDREVQRGTGRVPRGFQGAQPFRKINVRGIGWKRDAAAGEKGRQNRCRERMGIIYG